MDSTLREAKRLYALGFAIHWLRPKSKAPVLDKWTSGPKHTWKALAKSYRKGMNVGVRLGHASVIRHRYLAVIDIDVKSTDPKHKLEAYQELWKVVPNLPEGRSVPTVLSGRGNGSAHLYIATKSPVAPQKLAWSEERVKVFMPSSGISDAARKELTKQEIKKGIRIRPAWEIAVMGEGQQVVLPPSVHPDSGKEYQWTTPLSKPSDLVELTFKSQAKKITREKTDWKPVEVDLVSSNLSSETVDLILTGECEDRSAALFKVAIEMLREGFTDAEILTILTDTSNGLGSCAYEHAKTRSRKRAANWVYNYTIKKARIEISAAKDFEDEVEIEPLSEADADAQIKELIDPPGPDDWQKKLIRTQHNAIASNLRNVILILQSVSPQVFRKDLFANSEIYGSDTPWGGKCGAEITDTDIVNIKRWVAKRFGLEPGNDKIQDAIVGIGHDNAFHPVRDYLATLDWDGVPRIDTWLKDYLHAKAPEPYLAAVSRKLLCALIARVMVPGTKFDQVVILEGKQGVGKSTALRHLVGDAWFSDAFMNIQDKDAVLGMRSVWLKELGELSGMRGTDAELLKEFLSRTVDRVRVPYGRRTEPFPRQCIFVGTTNKQEYLQDDTGNRRFWPMKVGRCNFRALRKDRDQLLAEAYFAWQLDEPLYLEELKAQQQAEVEQHIRTIHDSWTDLFLDAMGKDSSMDYNRFRMADLFDGTAVEDRPFGGVKMGYSEQKRVGSLLRKLGYSVHVEKFGKERISQRVWRKRDA